MSKPVGKPIEAVIHFNILSFCVTTQEFEQMKRDVEARHMTGCTEIGDRLLARLLLDHSPNYRWAKDANLYRKGKQIAARAPRRKRCRCFRCKELFPIRSMKLVLLDGTQWSCDNCWDAPPRDVDAVKHELVLIVSARDERLRS